MKKLLFLSIIIAILFIASCELLDNAGVKSATITLATGYDLDNGKSYTDLGDPNVDLILEPWYKDGNPAPTLQHAGWGDSTTFIFDLGVISITDAANKSESELTPDSIVWDIYPVEEGHTYYVITSSLNEFFVYIRNIDITEYSNYYDATVDFDYMQRQ